MPQRERLYVIHRFRGQPHRDNVVIWRFHSRHMSEPVREELVIRKQNAELTRCWHRLNAPSGLSVICPTAVVKDEPRYRLSDLGGLVAHVVGNQHHACVLAITHSYRRASAVWYSQDFWDAKYQEIMAEPRKMSESP